MSAANRLNRRLHDAMAARAKQVDVDLICLGLGYTAVTTSDGGLGLAYTYFGTKTGCTLMDRYENHEGRPAIDLLALIEDSAPLNRGKALALINAMNHDRLQHIPDDRSNQRLFDILRIGPGSRVAMVGLFKPLLNVLHGLGAAVEVIDEFQGIGEPAAFNRKLRTWADAALITSTAILNNTLEDILNRLPETVRAAILGPSTPLIPAVFSPWPTVRALAGTIALDVASVLAAVRHGLGTPFIHRHSRKATITTGLKP